MTRLPSGTLTFLFSDIEGSTQRWERDREAMAEAVARHDLSMRRAISAHDGYVFKTVGDAFCAAFARPEEGVAAALDAQRSLAAQDFAAVDGVRVRIALHTGVTVERDGDYFGPTVNRVARLLSIGHGEQILLSGVTNDLVLGQLSEQITLEDLGNHRLKDLTRPEHVYQIAAPGLRRDFPPLRSLASFPNNLPLETTTFVGRDAEVADVVTLLEQHRIVTLVGSGGVGKTRVSLHVAAQLLETYDDGAWFVELAPLSNGAFVPSEIASAIGLRLPADGDPITGLVAALRSLRLLLVLDNCEHLVQDVAAIVAAIVRACPGVAVLASSRQPLGIAGEAAYRMPSLAFPPSDDAPTAQTARDYAAIDLFVARAEAADTRFALTDRNAPAIAEICRRLDGIALAIELAAARVRILSVEQLRQRLDERFRLLTGGSRDALARQQTMRALIDWSYDLLAPNERTLFNRLGIFAGGWTLDAAESIGADDSIDPLDIFDLLASLADKSLVVAEPDEMQTRYRFLESTRSYALERLASAGETNAVARRHAMWIADFAERADESYAHVARGAWLPSVAAELDNARAALTWALGEGADATLAAAIAGGLRVLWLDGDLVGEGRRWVRLALARVNSVTDARVAARLWRSESFFSNGKRRVDAAQRSLALYEKLGDTEGVAGSFAILAEGYRQMGRLSEAERAVDRALALYRECGKSRTKFYAAALDYRALLLQARGEIGEARALYDEAIALYEALGDPERAATPRLYLADLEFRAGNAEHALALVNEVTPFFAQRRNLVREANARCNAAAYRIALGQIDDAEREARTALLLAQQLQSPHQIATAIEHLANVAAARGDARRAARLSGYVEAWYRRESFEREWTEEQTRALLVRRIRELIAAAEIARYEAEGAALAEEDAVVEALTDFAAGTI